MFVFHGAIVFNSGEQNQISNVVLYEQARQNLNGFIYN